MSDGRRGYGRRGAALAGGVGALMFALGYFTGPADGGGVRAGIVDAGGASPPREVLVQFDVNVGKDLAWMLEPEAPRLRVRPGEVRDVHFTAYNLGNETVTAFALPNVAPAGAAAYLQKVDCFCFRLQTLAAGERRDLRLRFVVSPEIPEALEGVVLTYTLERERRDTRYVQAAPLRYGPVPQRVAMVGRGGPMATGMPVGFTAASRALAQ